MRLEQAVEEFARQACSLSDADLEKPWTWNEYDEGVRHAIFRTYEQLNELAARLEAARQTGPTPLSTAQRLLAVYHAGYRDLDALLLEIDDELGARQPGGEEWSLVQVLAHMIQAERSFFAITHYALQRVRGQGDLPLEMSEDAFGAFWAGDTFPRLREQGPFAELWAYYQSLHARVLAELGGTSEAELAAPTMFWEGTPYPVQYRLLRFDSHMRQHTIQIEKTLPRIGADRGEARLLVQRVYAALAGVEVATLGMGPADGQSFDQKAQQELADEIARRTVEVAAALRG